MTVLTTVSTLRIFLQAYADVITEDGDIATVEAHRVWYAILSIKFTFLFGTFTLLCAWSLSSLLFFHGVIISQAQTTNEKVRDVYGKAPSGDARLENQADQGCVHNWVHAFCSPVPASRLPSDMSETVVCRYNTEEKLWDGDEDVADPNNTVGSNNNNHS